MSGMTDSEVATAEYIINTTPTPSSNEFTLVTDDSTLASGDIVIIVSKEATGGSAVMTAATSGNYLAASTTDVTVSTDGNTVTLGDNNEALIMVLEGSSGAWKFRSGSNYLYASSTSKELSVSNNNSDYTHTVTISDGNATIKSGSGNRANAWYAFDSVKGIYVPSGRAGLRAPKSFKSPRVQ